MWNTLIFRDNYYIFQVILKDNNVIVNLSDLLNIWTKIFNKNQIIEVFKELNPLLDQDAEDLFKSCLTTLQVNFIDNLTINGDNEECTLKFKQVIDELPVKIDFILEKQAGIEVMKQVTIPLIQTVQYLEFKQKKLELLLEQKDKELTEYKLEYGKISRTMLETEVYVPINDIKPNLMLKVFTSNNDDFNYMFAEKHGDVQQLYPEIKEQKKPEKRKLTLAPTKYKFTKQ